MVKDAANSVAMWGRAKDAANIKSAGIIFRMDRFRFLYYKPFFNMKICQFQLVSQLFSIIFYTL
jgi:hypothetical protein